MDISIAIGRILQVQKHLSPQQPERSDAEGVYSNPLSTLESKAQDKTGWLPNRGGQPVIIGGMVMDIQGMTGKGQALHKGTTTPGRVFFTHGGVARNVAECMACLGAPPFLISVLGRDPPGEAMFSHWQELGLPTEGILRKKAVATPIVSAILDPGGEIAASIDDITAIEEHVTPGWIGRFESVIAAAPIVVLDANLLHEVIWTACQIAAKHGVPTWFEPVSISKSTRASRALSLLTFVSPSEEELASVASSASKASANMKMHKASIPSQEPAPQEAASKLQPHNEARVREGPECADSQKGLPSRHFAIGSTGRKRAEKVGLVDRDSSASIERGVKGGNLVDAESVANLLRKYEPDVRKILEAGVRFVLLTLGSHGVFVSSFAENESPGSFDARVPSLMDNGHLSQVLHYNLDEKVEHQVRKVIHHHIPALPAKVAGLTGAGDSVVAGFVAGLVTGQAANPVEAAAFGVAAAKQTVQSVRNVPDGLSMASLQEDASLALRQTVQYS